MVDVIRTGPVALPVKVAIEPDNIFDLTEGNLEMFITTIEDFFIRRRVYYSYHFDSARGLFIPDSGIGIENLKIFRGISKTEKNGKAYGVKLHSEFFWETVGCKNLDTNLDLNQLPKIAFLDDNKLYLSIGNPLNPFSRREKSLYHIINESID